MAHFIVGDVHACLNEFEELLRTISYNSNHNVILCGDFLERGYDSLGVVRKIQELKIQSVMGNHEFKVLQNPQKYSNLNLQERDLDFIKNLPKYLTLDNYIIVHAGLRANIPLEQQSTLDLLNIRYLDENGKMLGLTKLSKICNKKYNLEIKKDEKFFDDLNSLLIDKKEDLKIKFWTDLWKGPQSVIYGHSVRSTKDPIVEEVQPNVFCYGLDTGACFGGFLTAFCVETKEFIKVKSNYTYLA